MMKTIENNIDIIVLKQQFVDNILIDLCIGDSYLNKDCNIIKENKLLLDNIGELIERTATALFINGITTIYIYEQNSKLIITDENDNKSKEIKLIKIKFPRCICCNIERKHMLSSLLKSHSNHNVDCYTNDFDYSNYVRIASTIEVERLTRKFTTPTANNIIKIDDYYYVFRYIRQKRNQILLLNHIFKELNKTINKILGGKIEETFLIIPMDNVNKAENMLLRYEISLVEIINNLNKNPYIT